MSTEQYGLEINISTNVTEVQNGITEVKEPLESLSNTKYEIKIDDTFIQNLNYIQERGYMDEYRTIWLGD